MNRTEEEKNDPNYLAGLAGEWRDFPDPYPDVTHFIGESAQQCARESNEVLCAAQKSYKQGLMDYLQRRGVTELGAERIASAAGVQGFRLALMGGELIEKGHYVDPDLYISDHARRQASKVNDSILQRRAGYNLGLKIARLTSQTTYPR